MRTLTESDLIALDRREYAAAVARELERINAQPIGLSVIRDGKQLAQSKLQYLSTLLDVATPEQRLALDAEIAEQTSVLNRCDAELAAREEELKVQVAGEAQEPVEPHVDDIVPVMAEAIDSTPPPCAVRSRPGRPGKGELHAKVADKVAEIGSDWKSDENLQELAEWMNSSGIDVEKRFRDKRALTWAEKLDDDRVNFIKAIEYRLNRAKN